MEKDVLKLNNLLKTKENVVVSEISTKDVAIIGIAAKLPKAECVDGFWNNIKEGVDCITNIPLTREKDIRQYYDKTVYSHKDIEYSLGGYLNRIDEFDYTFFNLSPKEASTIDPVQRLFLQTAIEAIEDAGYGGARIEGSNTGIFIGHESDDPFDYKHYLANLDINYLNTGVTGNLTSIIGGRLAHYLDLKGMTLSVDTACSSSLVSVHLACESLRHKKVDMAIVGGVRINILPIKGRLDFGVTSSHGRTRAFDADADGTGSGEGAITMVLKPLHRAIADRDNVYGVIKGSAVNQDGRTIGISAPNPYAQQEVIQKAITDAGIHPETITYIEAHGTGTRLGDPIEIEGIQKAFSQYTSKKQFCGIGSVKTNIGHLDNLSGLAGLLKATLMLKHKELVPTLHFDCPNDKIDFTRSPVYVNTKNIPWEPDCSIRRCGVSSFGFSGTNCHMVLEEYIPKDHQLLDKKSKYLFLLSAKSKEALKELLRKYLDYFIDNKITEDKLGDICYTLSTGRWHYPYRIAIIVKEVGELVNHLRQLSQETDLHNAMMLYDYNSDDKKIDNSHITNGSDNLGEIRMQYLSGKEISFDKLYQKSLHKKISLPTYPFEKHRCWIDPGSEELYDYMYEIGWNKEELPLTSVKKGIIIFVYGQDNLDRLQQIKLDPSWESLFIEVGQEYGRDKNISKIPNSIEGFISVFSTINIRDVIGIIDITSLSSFRRSSIDISLVKKDGLYSYLNMIKALLQVDIELSTTIVVGSEYIDKIEEQEELIFPENALLKGGVSSMRWEHPQIKCKLVDVDSHTNLQCLVLELTQTKDCFNVTYRHNIRHVETLIPFQNKERVEPITFKENGIYIIAGGIGGIGLEVAKYLASQKRCHIIMLNRRDYKTKKQLTEAYQGMIDAILNTGSTVSLKSVDICNQEELTQVIEDIKREHGKINGVIHCAGIAKGVFLETVDLEFYDKLIASKVEGTINMYEAIQNEGVEFFILMSSVITLIGGYGGSAYTSANAFMDAFSKYVHHKTMQVVTINWPMWQKTGLAANKRDNQSDLFRSLSPYLSIRLLDKVLQTRTKCCIVGDFNLKNKLLQLDEYLPFRVNVRGRDNREYLEHVAREHYKENTTTQLQKNWSNKDEAYQHVEKIVKCCWQEALGYNQIEGYDNFFNLGGNSIMLVEIRKKLGATLSDEIRIVDLYTYTTIEELSAYIVNLLYREQVSDNKIDENTEHNLDDIIKELGEGTLSFEKAFEKYSEGSSK